MTVDLVTIRLMRLLTTTATTMEVKKVTLERDSINMVQGLDQVLLRLIQLCMDWIISLQGIVKSTYVICTFEFLRISSIYNLRLPMK